MTNRVIHDNIYQEGSFITAKVHPDSKLVIMKYNQRIYYCAIAGHPEEKLLVYFERELIDPILLSQSIKFTRVESKFSL